MQRSRRSGDPVFVDGSGRRHRLFAMAGVVGGLVLVLAVLAMVAGFTGVRPGSVPGWPGAGQVQRVPKPGTSGSTPATADPRADATTSATPTAARTAAAVPGSTTTTAPRPPTTPTPVTTDHRRVPTQTPTAHPSKRH